jgi:hypothetical protein
MNKHKQQIFWQIYLPMLLVVGLFAFLIYSSLVKTLIAGMYLRIWADISLIFILLPFFLFFVLIFCFLFLVIYFLNRNQPSLRAFLSNISDLTTIFSHSISKFTSYFSQPVIQVESIFSQLFPHKKDK